MKSESSQATTSRVSHITAVLSAIAAVGAVVASVAALSNDRDQTVQAKQDQMADRYSKAVEQIGRQGVDHLLVRLGGIYALEGVVRDSPRDQPTVVEVLSAFVRVTAPESEGNSMCPGTQPGLDVRAALAVLARRDSSQDQGARVELYGSCLNSIVLLDADLRSADLSRARLNDTDLRGADLRDADLKHVKLRSTDLTGAELSRADLSGADLFEADLSDASLIGVDLEHADLRNSYLGGADLRNALNTDKALVEGAYIDGNTKGAWW